MFKRMYYSILDADINTILFRLLTVVVLLFVLSIMYIIALAIIEMHSNRNKEYLQQYHYCIVANKTLPNPDVVCRSQATIATQQ